MMNWKKLLMVFAGTYFVLFVISYIVITVFPIFAVCVLIINAACQSGSLWNLIVSLLIYNGVWAVILSPFVVDYLTMKKEADEMHDEIDQLDTL